MAEDTSRGGRPRRTHCKASSNVSVAASIVVISAFLLMLALSGIVVEKNTSGSPSVVSSAPSFSSADPVTVPSARSFHSMVYDAESDRIVLFGGWAEGSTSETWAYDYANEWVKMNPPVAPSPRDAHAMAYDASSDRVILFGGITAGGPTAETWAYDLNADTWTNMAPAAGPPARLGARMVYAEESDRVILFGGHNGQCYGDTWAYDFDSNTWAEMAPTSSPSSRAWQAMAYDARTHRIVLFGGDPCTGFTPGDDYDDTWTYDLANDSWTNMNPPQSPTRRAFGRAAYGAESDRILLFGGNAVTSETWAYDSNANVWDKNEVTPRPSDRVAHTMAYDGESDRTILFGGSWPPGISVSNPSLTHNNETWAYDYENDTWSPLTPPSAPRSLEAIPGNGVVDLTWLSPAYDYGASVSGNRISRGTVSGDLAFLTEVGNVLSYEDANVTFGVRYFYQVRAVSAAGESPRSNEASASPADATSPTIDITSPQDSETLDSASAVVMGIASDNVAVEKVELSTEEITWVLAEGTTNWSGSLTLEVGSNTIYARATDMAGNEATTSIQVTYPPPPPGINLIVLGVAAGAVGAAAIAGVLLLRRRHRK